MDTLIRCPDDYRFFFFQAEDGIRDLVRSRGLGDVYKRQMIHELMKKESFQEDLIMLEDNLNLVASSRELKGVLGQSLSLIHI